ncbi:MAG: glycosyltransferase family 4 protein [Bryobacteraceae bacterium]|nr:glycosyltransferase family 4 protein [Bryobacteraceae bacterium]
MVVATIEHLCLASLTVLSEVLAWHLEQGNTYTPVAGLPEHATAEVIESSLLRAFSGLRLAAHLQDPKLIVQSLLNSPARRELPFDLRSVPFNAQRTAPSSVGVRFQTPNDVSILRTVARKLNLLSSSEVSGLRCWKHEATRQISRQQRGWKPLCQLVREWDAPALDCLPLRVLYVSHGSAFSGPQQSLVRLVRALDRKKIEPHLLAGMRGELTECLEKEGVRVHCRDREFLSNTVETMGYLLSVVNEARPHVIHLNSFDGFPIVNVAHLLNIPVLAHVRVGRINSEEAHLLRSAHVAVAVSNTARRAAEEAGVRPRNVVVIHNGVEYPNWINQKWDKATARHALGLPADAKIALMVARIDENKRQQMFLDAMAAIRQKLPSAHVLLVGEAYTYSDVFYHDSLIDNIDRLGLHDAVTIMGFQSNILLVEAACDVIVSCSRTEALPTSLIEAMSLGIPAVATQSGGSGEVIRDGKTGFLVAEDDVTSLRDRLLLLLSDEALRRRMGDAAKADVSQRFSVNRCAEAMQNLYRKLIDSRRRSHLYH